MYNKILILIYLLFAVNIYPITAQTSYGVYKQFNLTKDVQSMPAGPGTTLTSNAQTGYITFQNRTIGALGNETYTVKNNYVKSNSVVIPGIFIPGGGAGTLGFTIQVAALIAGQFNVTVTNLDASPYTGDVVFTYFVNQ